MTKIKKSLDMLERPKSYTSIAKKGQTAIVVFSIILLIFFR